MNLTYRFLYLICFLFLLAFAGCATKQPSLYDTNPELLTKQYTRDEIAATHKNFNANPSQYSQQFGSLILWRMHQKSPEFALEFAQTPELNDGINPDEARAMRSIYSLIKDLNIPPDLLEEKGQYERDIHKIIIEWQGNSREKSKWNGWFQNISNRPLICYTGKVLNAESLEFEQGEDKIDYADLKEFAELRWNSKVSDRDTDGVIVTLRFPLHEKISLYINKQQLKFSPGDILSQSQLVFDEKHGLKGKLIIRNAYKTNLTPELFGLKEMVLAGKGDYKFSAPLQALLWGYMDGKFKEGDKPFENYQGALEFVKPIWGDMEGPRWEDFDEVADRLNSPELIAFYLQTFFDYDYSLLERHMSARWFDLALTPRQVFKHRGGVCIDAANFACALLKRAGYEVHTFTIDDPSHTVAIIKENGKIYKLADTSDLGVIRGPFQSYKDVAKTLGRGYYFIDGRAYGW